ncbi:DUF317 domain-containing protein [Streptomyces sp. NPDC097617]|uniref:DUF317 domain-containing protein n=1 Tax=Streptomyces sp. NPDC097617 TaxID=3366091 RepID=UPI0037F6FF20
MSITERQLAAFTNDHESNLGSAIAPRYLAGAGDPRHVTHALRSCGWSLDSDTLHPAIHMTSPDHGHRLSLGPAGIDPYVWRIDNNYSPPAHWQARFGGSTPAEIVAGLTDAMIRPAPQEPAPSVTELLTSRGWQYTSAETGSETLASPDGIVEMTRYVSPLLGFMGWELDAGHQRGAYGPQQLLWRAHFDDATPAHLLAAVAAAVCDPAPVLRARFDIDSSDLLTQSAEFAIGDQVVAAHKQRLAEARRHRPKPPSTPSAPAPALPNTTTTARPTR